MSKSADPKEMEIDASPTKELFINMLVRDIPLMRALLDLIDNSIDGAHRSQANEDYSKFTIRIDTNKDYFKIVDNCGGISVKIAREYAFRFGRPQGVKLTPSSIGKFGVGMKRTFFKLGNRFKVVSTTTTSRFVVDVDVEEWRKKVDWHFRFNELEENIIIPEDQIGTNIEISSLHEEVSNSFVLETFITSLRQEIETAHSLVMNKGLIIILNSLPLGVKEFSLFKSKNLQPAYLEEQLSNDGASPVTVKIYAGLSERSLEEGGWYLFCNGRMVLEHDQSIVTGWGEGGSESAPKYHPDFAYFRGYVFFDSADGELLPWTTTKTGVDTDSKVYKAVKLKMVNIMKPILDFLRKMARERALKENGEVEESPRENLLKAAKVNYAEITTPTIFIAKPIVNKIQAGPAMGTIQYWKSEKQIAKVKRMLGVNSNKAVGEKTFDYYLANEDE